MKKLTREHRVDRLECLIDFFANFRTSEDDLPADEDQQNDLRFVHAVDKTGEQFGLVGAEVVMAASQSFEADGELDVARANDILNLEVREFGIEPEFLDDASVFTRGKFGIVFRLCASDDHLAGGKDKSGRLRVTDAHYNSCETLEKRLANLGTNWQLAQ